MVTIAARMVDGTTHIDASFHTLEDALAYLQAIAEECAGTHCIVRLNEQEGTLLLSYGGDDSVLLFILPE
jgi:kynurenine formamidase